MVRRVHWFLAFHTEMFPVDALKAQYTYFKNLGCCRGVEQLYAWSFGHADEYLLFVPIHSLL